jgi:ribosome biogenesis protein Tsr3
MHLDTKLEIQQAAQRLIPILTKANAVAGLMCLIAALAVVAALVVVSMSEDAYINGVTDSGEVHVIPLK